MTSDSFEYYKDDDFQWTGILEFYKEASFTNLKGVTFTITLSLIDDLESLDITLLKSFGQSWTWGEDRRIKAFKLLDFKYENKDVIFKLETIRKSKGYDEIKYLLIDLGAYINHIGNKITNIQINQL